MIAFGIMLACACAASWMIVETTPSSVRAYVRFACAFYLALGVATAASSELVRSVALLVMGSAPAFFVPATAAVFYKPLARVPASLVLLLAGLGGIFAAATGLAVFAFMPTALSVVAVIALNLPNLRQGRYASVQCMFAMSALLAGAASYAADIGHGLAPLVAFTATGLVGLSLALNRLSDAIVEKKGSGHRQEAGSVRIPRRRMV
jgi:hypothetical protein